MKTFKIEGGDIVFDSQNNIAMVDGQDEEIQSIERVITTNINEFFLNPEHGFNYSVIQTKQVDEETIRLSLIEAITQENRVDEVEEINLSFDRTKRHISINFRAKLISGNAVEGEVIV